MAAAEPVANFPGFSADHNPDHRGDCSSSTTFDPAKSNLDPVPVSNEKTCEKSNTEDNLEKHSAAENTGSGSTVPLPHPSTSPKPTTSLSSTASRETLHANAQEIIEEINAKRKQDTQILTDFKKAMEMQVSKMCNLVEQQMFKTYDKIGKDIQGKLQELYATLDRIAQVEAELQQFRQALQILYQEMQSRD